MNKDQRIETLDAFRFISITLVALYHYMTRWTYPILNDNYYPYADAFRNIPIIRDGDIGVQFFFVISGFVILFTLERTKSLKDFMVRRFIRLWPTILLCSILTFIIIRITGANVEFSEFDVSLKSFLPSLTFTPPRFWDVQYVDGVYWSLEVEVKFYIISAVLYFIFKKHFSFAWALYSGLVIFCYLLFYKQIGTNEIFLYLTFPRYISFFASGILFYELFKGNKSYWVYIALVFFFAYGLYIKDAGWQSGLLCAIYAFFVLFIYKNNWLSWMNRKWVLAIGVSSYPLYLLHQHLGILLINKMGVLVPLSGYWQLIYPIVTYAIFCVVCYWIYINYEMKVKGLLMKLFYPSKNR